jgi:hypothetical protein
MILRGLAANQQQLVMTLLKIVAASGAIQAFPVDFESSERPLPVRKPLGEQQGRCRDFFCSTF